MPEGLCLSACIREAARVSFIYFQRLCSLLRWLFHVHSELLTDTYFDDCFKILVRKF